VLRRKRGARKTVLQKGGGDCHETRTKMPIFVKKGKCEKIPRPKKKSRVFCKKNGQGKKEDPVRGEKDRPKVAPRRGDHGHRLKKEHEKKKESDRGQRALDPEKRTRGRFGRKGTVENGLGRPGNRGRRLGKNRPEKEEKGWNGPRKGEKKERGKIIRRGKSGCSIKKKGPYEKTGKKKETAERNGPRRGESSIEPVPKGQNDKQSETGRGLEKKKKNRGRGKGLQKRKQRRGRRRPTAF